ncbi:Cnga4 [Symbiodinium natans]|uniref:Cnga4 protein n=1 Tax=Symbiodinium natans TaxID=878477 RepID=A0A812JQQ7_9DINO|nr:Cnga4 [Symbiodinium natans]
MRVSWRQGDSTLWDAYSKQGSIDFNGILQENEESNPNLHEVIIKTSHGCTACLGRCVLHPYGWPKFFWSFILLLAVLWDAITIPLQLFDLGSFSTTLDSINTATIIFWLTDIPVSCFTAVDRDGVLDFRPRSCVHDYIRGWCLPDVLMVLGDLVVSTVGSNQSLAATAGTQGLRVSRLIRLSRLVRLVRLYKASATVESLVDYVRSPLIVVLIGLTKLILFILFVNHYIACAWCAMAYFSEGTPTWADGHMKAPDDFRELYALSLHWSLTQFTPSTQDIGPSNIRERIFAAGVVIFALIVFSSFVSSITNQMNQIRTWNAKSIELDALLRHFLKSRKISTQLGVRITNFFKVSQKQKAETPLESISFLASLPESLKIHLYSEIFLPAFKTSGLFSRVMRVDYRLLSKTCSRAFKEQYCPPEIDIFIEGATAAGVLIVHRGDMTYQLLGLPGVARCS